MGIRTLLYLFRLGLKNLWHHRVYTAASVITMSACIFLFGLFYLAAANVDSMVKKTEQEVYVAVFFDEGILPERVEEIGNLIQSRPEVLRTVYVSADEAWSGFKEKYYENAEALDGIFETDNPLASSGNYQVYIDRIGSQEGFVEYEENHPFSGYGHGAFKAAPGGGPPDCGKRGAAGTDISAADSQYPVCGH